MKRLAVVAAVLAACVIAAAAGTGVALDLERHDGFCALCHTEPETAYVGRARMSAPSDLASAHVMLHNTRCIDCHSGAGAFGRADGLKQGAQDLAAYLVGNYNRPAVTTNPLPDANCVKCHGGIADTRSLRNHYHYYLPNWQAKEPASAAHCVDCHTSHSQGASRTLKYASDTHLNPICAACHAFSGIRS